jgi:hypothetical protein
VIVSLSKASKRLERKIKIEEDAGKPRKRHRDQ